VIPQHYSWFSALAFTKDGVGFAVGDEGKILTIHDGGKTWTRLGLPSVAGESGK
jgi:photosystem II stability/assembly factor-like uncharacterized protein